VAALADAVENVALLKMLVSAVVDPWPRIAWVSATIKFGIIAVGLAYVVYGVPARVL